MWDPAGVEFNDPTAADDDTTTAAEDDEDEDEDDDEVDVVVKVPFCEAADSLEWYDRLQKDEELDAHEDELQDEAVDPVDDLTDDKLRRFIMTLVAAPSASDGTLSGSEEGS